MKRLLIFIVMKRERLIVDTIALENAGGPWKDRRQGPPLWNTMMQINENKSDDMEARVFSD